MGILAELQRLPGNLFGFGRDTANIVNPARLGGSVDSPSGVATIGTRFVGWMNKMLSGKNADGTRNYTGTVVRVGLAFGLIATATTLIGNYLKRFREKRMAQSLEAEAEVLNLEAQAAEMHKMADYLESGAPLLNVNTRNDFRQRFAPDGPKSLENRAVQPEYDPAAMGRH